MPSPTFPWLLLSTYTSDKQIQDYQKVRFSEDIFVLFLVCELRYYHCVITLQKYESSIAGASQNLWRQ